jgi:hypothetical protein
MNLEIRTFSNAAEATFVLNALRLFHSCPAPLASKKIAILLTGERLDTFVYPDGSHADVLSHATRLHAQAGFIADAAAVFGGCATPGCPCDGKFYILISALLPNGEQHTAESQYLVDPDLDGVIADMPALVYHIRSLSATPGALNANMVFHG